jgi:hypothetical protein
MKSFTAFILRVDSFEEGIQDVIVDAIIESYAKQHLVSDEDGQWNMTIDNENKTFILFINHTLGIKYLNEMRDKLLEIDFGKDVILELSDITDKLLHTTEYHKYSSTCERAKKFISENLDVDCILEKISSSGIQSLTDLEKQILAA